LERTNDREAGKRWRWKAIATYDVMRLVRLVQAALRASAAQLYSFSIESIQSVLKAPHQRIAVSIETQTDLSLSLLTH